MKNFFCTMLAADDSGSFPLLSSPLALLHIKRTNEVNHIELLSLVFEGGGKILLRRC
jgi:hypothetical protein